jgi:arsenite-transporting ATPase
MRIILHTGKGGVGKTSVASATGVELARRGYKTLVMSVDPAHSVADSFDLGHRLLAPTGTPIKIRPNLWIQEVDIQQEVGRHWKHVHGYVASLLNISGLNEILAEELAIFPGMEEVSSLMYINQYIREKTFDVILLDCAPTAESLRFISIPNTLQWYMDRLFSDTLFNLERRVAKVMRPLVNTFSPVPMPEDECFAQVKTLYENLRGIDKVLTNPEITTVRLVTTPEKMVLKETQRAFMFFCLYGMTVDAVIVNRLLPEDVQDNFFNGWKSTQERHLNSIGEFFAPVPIWKIPLFNNEILGLRELDRLGKAIYGSRDPALVYYKESPYRFGNVDGVYQLRMKLPFVETEDVDMFKHGDELVVRVGAFKRHIPLPQRMSSLEPKSARVENGDVIITFFSKLEIAEAAGAAALPPVRQREAVQTRK